MQMNLLKIWFNEFFQNAQIRDISSGLLLSPSVAAVVAEEESGAQRNWSSFFVAVRVLVSRLIDDSAYRDVSVGREISVIFTLNGPLIYRHKTSNDVRNESARSLRK
jgi:hypothetical protein